MKILNRITPQKSLFLWLLLGVTSLTTPYEGGAQNFINISPHRIKFSQKNVVKPVNITAMSENGEKTIQILVKRWILNSEGEDEYIPTKDIVVFPRLIKIKNGVDKIIRVAYKSEVPTDREKAYRLYVNEIPSARTEKDPDLRFVYNISFPIYAHALKRKDIVRKALIEEIALANEKLSVAVKNEGNVHISIGKITLAVMSETGEILYQNNMNGSRILSDGKKTYSLPLASKDCSKGEIVKVTVNGVEGFSENVLTGTMLLDKTKCSLKPTPTTPVLPLSQTKN